MGLPRLLITFIEQLRTLGRLASTTRNAWPLGFWALVLSKTIGGLLPLPAAWVLKLLLDRLADSQQREFSAVAWLMTAHATIALGVRVVNSVDNYLRGELGRRVTLGVQTTVYAKINAFAGLGAFETPEFHNAVQLASKGAMFGTMQMTGTVTALVQSATTIVGFAALLLAFSPILALAMMLAAAPELYVQTRLAGKRVGLGRDAIPLERQASYYGHVLSTASFAKELRLFGLAAHFVRAFQMVHSGINAAKRARQSDEFVKSLGLAAISCAMSAGALAVVVIDAVAGKSSVGTVGLYVTALSSIQIALSGMSVGVASLSESALFFSAFERLMTLRDPLPTVPSTVDVPRLRHGIELRNVSFRYAPDRPWVLRNVTATFPAGSCVALVGANGTGKSTLVKLLARFYDPTEGEILWDGINLREFDAVALRRRIGAVFQDFARFELSAYDNIGFGDVAAIGDRERVEDAARRADVHEVIARLSCGYSTVLSRSFGDPGAGAELSGGEWQKVALARLFMRDADLLILDEPTAALDARAEYDLHRHFVNVMSGRTAVTISHRFSTTQMAQLVFVLENGRIAERGSHAELMALGASYARMYHMQTQAHISPYPHTPRQPA